MCVHTRVYAYLWEEVRKRDTEGKRKGRTTHIICPESHLYCVQCLPTEHMSLEHKVPSTKLTYTSWYVNVCSSTISGSLSHTFVWHVAFTLMSSPSQREKSHHNNYIRSTQTNGLFSCNESVHEKRNWSEKKIKHTELTYTSYCIWTIYSSRCKQLSISNHF